MSVDVLIMAGTNYQRPVKGEFCKALVSYNGKPLVAPCLDAYLQSKEVRDVYLVGPKDRLEQSLASYVATGRVHIVQETALDDTGDNEAERMVDSAKRLIGARSLKSNDPYVLFSACDMPKISTSSIDDFLGACGERVAKEEMDYIQAVVHQDAELKYFSNMSKKERPAPKLKEGSFRLGNIAYVNVASMTEKAHVVELAYSIRKGREHPIRTAFSIFGVWNSIRLTKVGAALFGRTSVKNLRKRIRKKRGVNLDLQVVHPEIAVDFDNDAEVDGLKG